MSNIQKTTFAGGCFWCLESAFNQLNGVIKAYSGYAGGHSTSPTYESVCSGETGHAEVVQIEFDQNIIDYRALLEIFFAMHDPTQLNRQGNDIGTQYRSAIFYHSDEQKKLAEDIIREMLADKIWDDPIVTTIEPVANYHQAEDYHQDYFSNNPQNQYCAMVVSPKLKKFKQTFASKLK